MVNPGAAADEVPRKIITPLVDNLSVQPPLTQETEQRTEEIIDWNKRLWQPE